MIADNETLTEDDKAELLHLDAIDRAARLERDCDALG